MLQQVYGHSSVIRSYYIYSKILKLEVLESVILYCMHAYNDNGHIYVAMQLITNYSLRSLQNS